MAAPNNYVAWLAVAAIAGVMLLPPIPSFAQKVVRFNSHGTFGLIQDCQDVTCNTIQVNEGGSSGAPQAFLLYDVSWFSDPILYSLDGNGEIPVSDVHFSAQTAVSLNVDTSTVSGFSSQLCFFNTSTGESGCSQELPVVTMNLHSTSFLTTQDATSATTTFLNSKLHEVGTSIRNSATGTASIDNQSFSNVNAFIGIGQNMDITVTTGR